MGISDSSSTVYDKNGLDIDELIQFKESKKLSEYKSSKLMSNEELLTQNCDVLIPAALGGSITINNAKNVKANIIIELVNSPITPEADEILSMNNVKIIPDTLVNSGGVIVSYYEWVQNLQNYYWSEEKIRNELRDKIIDAYNLVIELSSKHNISIREASYLQAINKITTTQHLRGDN